MPDLDRSSVGGYSSEYVDWNSFSRSPSVKSGVESPRSMRARTEYRAQTQFVASPGAAAQPQALQPAAAAPLAGAASVAAKAPEKHYYSPSQAARLLQSGQHSPLQPPAPAVAAAAPAPPAQPQPQASKPAEKNEHISFV